MERKIYVIGGYDLTNCRNEIMTYEFMDSEEYEDLTCNKSKGFIQLIENPAASSSLYLGYIIGVIDEYDDYTEFELKEITFETFKELNEILKSILKEPFHDKIRYFVTTEWV